MKIKSLIILIILSLVFDCFSQDLPPLIPFRNGNKWGFVNKDMKTIIPFEYDYATPFSDDYENGKVAYVKKGKKSMWINESRKVTNFEPPLDEVRRFIIEYEFVYKEGKFYGMKDENGQVLLSPIYDSISYLSSNRILSVKKSDKFGFVNSKGRFITEIKYDEADPKDDYYPLLYVKYKGKEGYVDINGVEYFKD